ncbi:MAG TPA: YMGG-like glycine zipper-containing protein [Pyrinomonadaceae bacterium]|jgi:hypothetical protein|nr:YMGG-like glycine zipper-containing protein [Pyrinomonadaceae bacterium]
MTRRFLILPSAIVCLLIAGLLVQAQQRVYRGSYSSVRQTILRLENRTNLFHNSMGDWSQSATASYGGSDTMPTVSEFNDSVHRLRVSFDRRRATTYEVQDVLTRATSIDDFVRRNSIDARTLNLWNSIRTDLNQLASAFNLTWQTSAYTPPSTYPGNYGDQYGFQTLSGTYQVDRARSDNARVIAERAASNLPYSERTRVLDMVSRRLDAPDQLALDMHGQSVTMASTRAPQVTFNADGVERTETTPSGRTIQTRATLSGNALTIASNGDTGNQFTVTLQPLDNGRTLRVTRRIYTPELNQTVQVSSIYHRTSDVARFDIYNPNTVQYPSAASNSFIIPDGARVVGVLTTPLSTRTAATGDQFSLRVTEPAEFRDAIIAGHVSDFQRSGRISGRSVMTLDFDSIRLRNGRSYRFAGLLESVTPRNGESVRVDTEGMIRDQNQTTRTEERAAIGTAVGAIIGAIAGGGRGAAIGAVLGAGAGAGSVYAEGTDDLYLDRGTQLVIRAGAPYNGPR